jgi:hypothetical protein
VTDVLRKRLVVVLLAVALVAALGTASCAKKAAPLSTRPSAGTPTAPGTTAQAPTPGNIPAHLNADQLKKIDASKRDFTFAAFGDNRGSTTVFDTLISRVNADDLLFGLDNGDLVDSPSVNNYRTFMGQWDAGTKPLLTAIGNHDGGPSGIYEALFGARYYDFTVGDTLFLVLDGSNESGIDAQQLEWMKGKLAGGQSYKNRIVIMHVPLFDPRVGPEGADHALADTAHAKMLSGLFDQYHVTLLVTSHIHSYFEGTWGTTPYIISGGAGAPLYGTDPAHFFYHYVRVHVSDQGVTHEVVKI